MGEQGPEVSGQPVVAQSIEGEGYGEPFTQKIEGVDASEVGNVRSRTV